VLQHCHTQSASIHCAYDEEEATVTAVTISPKFQVVIPKDIREQLNLVPGQKVEAIAFGDRVELIPIRPATALRGMLRDLDTSFERDRGDRV
jgi:AbrB family looped-hinge helix DNA binding protein